MKVFDDLRIRKAQLFLHDDVDAVVQSAKVGSSGNLLLLLLVEGLINGCGAAAGTGWKYGVSVCMWPR